MHSAASDVYPPQLLAAIIPDRTLAEFGPGCEEQLDGLARDDSRAQISTILLLQAEACDFGTRVTRAERQDPNARSIELCPSAGRTGRRRAKLVAPLAS
jgi:hypothetical protein